MVQINIHVNQSVISKCLPIANLGSTEQQGSLITLTSLKHTHTHLPVQDNDI